MDLKRILETAFRSRDGLEGLVVREVKESSCMKPGDNYMSVASIVEVVGTLPGGTNYSEGVFIKRLVDSAQSRQLFQSDDAFNNESLFYLKLMPLCDVTHPFPRCYYACADLIVLQNLQTEGYIMADRRVGFDRPIAEEVLKAIARLHAATYFAQLTKSDEFSEVASHLNPVGLTSSSHIEMKRNVIKMGIMYVSTDPDLKELTEPLKAIDARFSNILNELREAKRIRVLCHGDCWVNNILVRPGQKDPVRLVDLQACTVLSPAVDVWTFLYTSLKTDVWEDIPQLVDVYCQSFLQNLETLGTPASHIPSCGALREEIISRELYGFLAGIMYAPALLMDAITLPNLDDTTIAQLSNVSHFQQFITPDLLRRCGELLRFSLKRGLFNNSMLK